VLARSGLSVQAWLHDRAGNSVIGIATALEAVTIPFLASRNSHLTAAKVDLVTLETATSVRHFLVATRANVQRGSFTMLLSVSDSLIPSHQFTVVDRVCSNR
jgi:hypothetical protein